jgi:hypothetical protein
MAIKVLSFGLDGVTYDITPAVGEPEGTWDVFTRNREYIATLDQVDKGGASQAGALICVAKHAVQLAREARRQQ